MELPEGLVATMGETFEELRENAVEALNLHLEDEGLEVTIGNIVFQIDLESFFSSYPYLNHRALADRVGMNSSLLSQYATGVKQASAKQTERLIKGINEIGRELADIRLDRDAGRSSREARRARKKAGRTAKTATPRRKKA